LRLQLDEVLPVVTLGATDRHLVASILVVPVLLVLFRLHGLYEGDRILAGTREYAHIAHAATYGVLITLAFSYFAGGSPLVSRSWLLLVWVLTVLYVGGTRFATRRVVRWLRRRGSLRTRVVIVGASTFGVAIAEQLRAATDEGIDVVGFLDEYLPIGSSLLDDVRVLGRPGDLQRHALLHSADEFVLVPQALPHERLEEISHLMASQEDVVVRIAVSSSDLLTHGVRIAERGSVPLLTLRRARLSRFESLLKGSLDRGIALGALVLLSPPALAAVIWSLAVGCRPVLTRRTIYSAGGGRGTLWLFSDGVATWPPLRGLPALFSVLRGQLSLVGPRPIECTASGSSTPPIGLTAVKPGLTGPWRLSGPGASLEDQALQDLTYVRNYNIWEDVRILAESVRRLQTSQPSAVLGRWLAPVTTH
jgi:lipopolysaccharide/colanic/teichoic acid biosynthesis glycosyltransferase